VTIPTPRDRSERAKRRRLHLLRTSPLCTECLKAGRAVAATELDHVIPLRDGGRDDETNLQGLCHQCHTDKSLRERGIAPKPTIGTDGWPIERE
jgi:5-methylcytosine-specific restriction protein A